MMSYNEWKTHNDLDDPNEDPDHVRMLYQNFLDNCAEYEYHMSGEDCTIGEEHGGGI